MPRPVALTALAIVGLNLADALFTVHHLAHGAVEVNPLMRALLEQGPVAFVLTKHFAVSAGVLAVLACARREALRLLRTVVLPAYAGVALYQVALFA